MKTIGMIGSVSWQATIDYYRIINEETAKRLGGHHSARIYMACCDFEELVGLAKGGNWDKLAEVLTQQVQKLERAGSDFFMICANTIHKVADNISSAVNIPCLNIVEATSRAIQKKKIRKATLLGTTFTMMDGFYQAIMSKGGIEIITPEEPERQYIHESIFEELSMGKVLEKTRDRYIEIINSQIKKGTEGIILGCTEIPLLIKQKDVSVPIFDTTEIHAMAAVEMALA